MTMIPKNTGDVTIPLLIYHALRDSSDKAIQKAENSKLRARIKELEDNFAYLGRKNKEKIERIDELENKLIMKIPVFIIGVVVGITIMYIF